MKHSSLLILIAVLIIWPAAFVQACSSYVVYSNEIVYGMNFDYSGDPEMLVAIAERPEGQRVFTFSFKPMGFFIPIAGMNDSGNFSNLQMVLPRFFKGTGQNLTYQIDRAANEFLYTTAKIDWVLKLVKEYRLTHVPANFYLHSMFADKTGAMIVEIGEQGNVLTHNTGNFLVMTNFYNGDFPTGIPKDFFGPGAERYRIITGELQANMGQFTFETASQILQKVSHGMTQASLVFFPEKQEIYLMLRQNFDRIWRISLQDLSIEAYHGFTQTRKIPLNQGGVTIAELLTWR